MPIENAQNASVGILFLASSLAFFGFKIHNDAVNFDIKYRPELEQIKRKLSARFKKKTVDLLALIVTDGTNDFKKPVTSLDDLKLRANRMDLPDKINELSRILTDIERMKTTYSDIRDLKKKMEGRFFVIAIIIGVNAILPFLDFPESGGELTPSQGVFLVLILVDFLSILLFIDIYTSYRGYSDKEESFLKKLDDVEVDSGAIVETSSNFDRDDE